MSEICFPLYPLGTSHICHDLSKTIKSGHTMTLSKLLSICGYIPSSLMDLCVSSFFKCSSVWSPSTQCESALDFPSCFRGLRLPEASLTIRIKKVKLLYTLAFPCLFVRSSAPFSRGLKLGSIFLILLILITNMLIFCCNWWKLFPFKVTRKFFQS